MDSGSEYARWFDDPDEVIEDDLVHEDVVHLAGTTVGRYVVQPGWRWSTHVKPRIGTEFCEARHVGVSLAGKLRVSLEDGSEFDIDQGQVFLIPSGHDIWVVGDEPATTIEWAGALSWHPGPETVRERVLVTVLMSDIVESTTTAQRLGDKRWNQLLRAHDDAVADIVNRYRGRLIKFTGDGALATFTSPERSVRAAIAMRDQIAGLGLDIRVGIHTGEVDVVADDIHGVTVHATARISGLAGRGEILVSALTAGLSGGASARYEAAGEHELRGVEGRFQLFRVGSL